MKTLTVDGVEYAPADVVRKALSGVERSLGVCVTKEHMTIKEFSEATGVLPGTVRALCADGRIPAVKLGRTWVVLAREALGLPPLQLTVNVMDEKGEVE